MLDSLYLYTSEITNLLWRNCWWKERYFRS